MRELGPLRFGVNPSTQLVESVKAATVAGVTGSFSLTLNLGDTGATFGRMIIGSSKASGATAHINWGNGDQGVISITPLYTINNKSCGSTIVISGNSNSQVNSLTLNAKFGSDGKSNARLGGFLGNFPSTLRTLVVDFNIDPKVFEIPSQVTTFSTSPLITGPLLITAQIGSKLTRIDTLNNNLQTLNLGNCSLLSQVPQLPTGLKQFESSPAMTTLPSTLPSTLTRILLSASPLIKRMPSLTGLTGLTYLSTPGGITGLTGLPSTITELNLGSSTLLASIPSLTGLTGLTTFYTPGGITTLTGSQLPPSLVSLYTSSSTKLVTVGDMSNLTKLTSLGLTYLPTLTSVGKLPPSCTALNVVGTPLLKNIIIDPATLKGLDFRNSGLPKPSIFIIPADCDYRFY
jgi:hypothetical protein